MEESLIFMEATINYNISSEGFDRDKRIFTTKNNIVKFNFEKI